MAASIKLLVFAEQENLSKISFNLKKRLLKRVVGLEKQRGDLKIAFGFRFRVQDNEFERRRSQGDSTG